MSSKSRAKWGREMIRGSCHCGAVQWQFAGTPESATACNCTICRRYGALWAYGFDGEEIDISGPTQTYLPRTTGFHFCSVCGCVAYWREPEPGPKGRRVVAVNLRLAEPDDVAQIPVDHIDGLRNFEKLPRDGRCIADHWF